MKILNPAIFKETNDGFELQGEFNYPTFMKELALRPLYEKEEARGMITYCTPVFNDAFYERIKKYNIKKVTWGGKIKVLSKDLIEYL